MLNYSDSHVTSDRPSQVVSVVDPEDEQMNQEIANEAARFYSDNSDSDDSDNVTKSMKKQKSLLLSETYELKKSRKCCASCKVVTNYLLIEQQKKQRALKIGIFTVFLVVCMITMLKSVVDSSPIIFVKIG